MPRILVSCPTCGADSALAPRAIRIIEGPDGGPPSYTFRCTTCREVVRRVASARTYSILLHNGVSRDQWPLPLEVLEPRRGQVITHDDILDFALAMTADDGLLTNQIFHELESRAAS